MSEPHDVRAVAVHEAAHLVIARALDPATTITATVLAEPDDDGVGGFVDGWFDGNRRDLAVMYLAGREGALLLAGRPDGSDDDLAAARRALRWSRGSIRAARRRAADLVVQYQDAIRAEADALLRAMQAPEDAA